MNLEDYGFDQEKYTYDQGVPARVVAVHRERYKLICEQGECFGRLKTKEYFVDAQDFPTAGDFVLIHHNPTGDSMIVKTLPRNTVFMRKDPDPSKGEQAVAANFDYVFIMQSLNHDFNPKRLERYLTLAWQSGAQPVVLLTKADLLEDFTEQIKTAEIYAMGTPVHAVSAQTGYGLDALMNYFAPKKTVVFLGSSGVGKSSLVNALAGEEIMATSGIREDDSRGRHTTTHRELIMLGSGAMIIDTPGMRALGMWDVTLGMGSAFADVEQYLGCCKYSDCRHQSEPGCAIKQAIESGELTLSRWESYLALKKEARYADDKEGFLRDKREWHKALSKGTKQLKKSNPKHRF
ncbi:MAG: ribosome small subunit-dependent GTPase A [Clostridia bacterium]|nr:ribosome small subunit-dependent GTPase A [Clostridia bacterium]